MAKTQEELNTLKTEYESLTTKLKELSDDELNMVAGGIDFKLLRELMGIIFKPLKFTNDGNTVDE